MTPTGECAALLAAIHAAPDDDAPRLVFADWLDEHGQPERAEFIRLQIEMHRERTEHGRITPRSDELFVRQRELFRQPWAEGVRSFGSDLIGVYSRGFAAVEFRLPASYFAAHARTLASWFGPGSSVCLVQLGVDLPAAAATPELACVRELTLFPDAGDEKPLTPADLKAFFQSPYLSGLRNLTLAHLDQTRRLTDTLADADALTHLEHLDVEGNRLGTAGLFRLAVNPRFAGLRILSVRDTGETDRGVQALLESPHLAKLERLIAGGYGLTAAFLDRLPPARRAVLHLVVNADE